MCGIVGILGQSHVANSIADGLKRLEYRGYDSSGVATLLDGQIVRRRKVGKLKMLMESLAGEPLMGLSGIGHTRWATHGAPVERNAHPHLADNVCIVHNGIIENFADLRMRLESEGVVFESETDSETIAHLINSHLARAGDPIEAFERTLLELEGAFALGAIVRGEEDLLLGARRGAPLAFGLKEGEAYLGSDALALAPFVPDVTYLEDGDWVVLRRNGSELRDTSGRLANREARPVRTSAVMADKGEYRHFMVKEIHEQPEVLMHTLSAYADPATKTLKPLDLAFDWNQISKLTIVACGTAYYAGLVGKYWFEQIARLPVEADIASEFRYREAPLPKGGAALFVSQSGETADTLAALRYCLGEDQHTIGIVNVPDSTIARECGSVVPTSAGVEVGVASTKAFTAQLGVLAALALNAAKARGQLTPEQEQEAVGHLLELPRLVTEALALEKDIAAKAHDLSKSLHALFVGRGRLFPLAMEGALKLKEISYIHAEGYAAGELKHGPIALVDEEMPIIALAPSGPLYDKTTSNIQEVIARGGKVILFSDAEGIARAGNGMWATIEMPSVDPLIAPFIYAVPVQLLAYHAAVSKGTDVDQPRNLAKSVTVE